MELKHQGKNIEGKPLEVRREFSQPKKFLGVFPIQPKLKDQTINNSVLYGSKK